MNICIIPARGGSQRIPGKNSKIFHGKPIILYSIECAKATGIFDRIVVSTDSMEIAHIANEAGVTVHNRSPETALNEVGTQEVMRIVLNDMEDAGLEVFPGYACCLYATAPMLQPETLIDAYKVFDSQPSMNYVVPVATWLRDPGQFYFGSSGYFMEGSPLISAETCLIKIDPLTECDINTPEDWSHAEEMYANLMKDRNDNAN